MNSPDKKIPTILLTGFLGAGKTTLLNRLIEYYRSTRTVLLINEFGRIGIDGDLLSKGNYQKIELNKGSLFCICVRTDFIFEVEKIAIEFQPDLLIIEATGMADTSEMEKMLSLPNLKDKIHLKACLCLVDCLNFLKIKIFLKAPVSQVRSADLVLLNKMDCVTPEQLAAVTAAVQEISPNIPIIPTKFAEFPLTRLDSIRHPLPAETGVPGEGRPDIVVSVTLEAAGEFTRSTWERFLALVKPQIMRLKGFVWIENQYWHVDATTEQLTIQLATKNQTQPNRLVLIGQNLNEDDIQQTFKKELGESRQE